MMTDIEVVLYEVVWIRKLRRRVLCVRYHFSHRVEGNRFRKDVTCG